MKERRSAGAAAWIRGGREGREGGVRMKGGGERSGTENAAGARAGAGRVRPRGRVRLPQMPEEAAAMLGPCGLRTVDLQRSCEYLGEHVAAGGGFGEGDPLEPEVDVALELFDGAVEDEVDVTGARVLVLLYAAR